MLLPLLGLTQQIRAEKDAVDRSSIKLNQLDRAELMQVAAGAFTDMVTKIFGPQHGNRHGREHLYCRPQLERLGWIKSRTDYPIPV
jgi:hypothetical protein